MGLADAMRHNILRRPMYDANWRFRPDAELHAYLSEILRLLETRPYGPYLATKLVFGEEIASMLAAQGECLAEPEKVMRGLLDNVEVEEWAARNNEDGDEDVEMPSLSQDEEDGIDPRKGDAERIIRSPTPAGPSESEWESEMGRREESEPESEDESRKRKRGGKEEYLQVKRRAGKRRNSS